MQLGLEVAQRDGQFLQRDDDGLQQREGKSALAAGVPPGGPRGPMMSVSFHSMSPMSVAADARNIGMDGNEMSFVAKRRKLRGQTLSEALARVLSAMPAKTLARITGASPRAAQQWKVAASAPSADALLRLATELDEVWAVVRAQAGRSEGEAERMLDDLAAKLRERRR
jgi:hypothetical protein